MRVEPYGWAERPDKREPREPLALPTTRGRSEECVASGGVPADPAGSPTSDFRPGNCRLLAAWSVMLC